MARSALLTGVPPANDGFTTVFFSVGKNRRVFPADLIRFIQDALQAEPGELRFGPVKIMAGYSFVDLNPAAASKAIELLNGREFKGRTLTVNYARKK